MNEELRVKDILRLQEANKMMKPMAIKDKDYVPVNERIKAFRMMYPRGRIITEIVSLENGVVTMKASIYTDEGILIATGYAQEKEGSTFINKTSYIENCETSCVGRALGNAGLLGSDSFASYEEVANAMAQQNDGLITTEQFEDLKKMYSKDDIKVMYKQLGITKASDIPVDFYEKKKQEHEAKVRAMEAETKAEDDRPFY